MVAYFVGTLVDILSAECFGERVLAHSTITKYHRLGVLNNKIYFSQSREWEVQHQGAGKVVFIPRPLLAYRCRHLLVCSHDLLGETVRVSSLVSLFIRALISL